ncbi:MAG: FAD-dependent oxidoreductase [Chloroflexota bacterium]
MTTFPDVLVGGRGIVGSATADRLVQRGLSVRSQDGPIYFDREDRATFMADFVAQRQADGVDIRLLDGPAARSLTPILPETVIGASDCPLDAQMDPRRYVRAFGNVAQRAGVRILEGTAVRALVV